MDNIFINSGNIEISDSHRLLLDRSGVINMLLYQILAFIIHGKI